MNLVESITTIAVLQYLTFGALTARERGRSGLQAPAVVGNAGFERMYRVQANTLELLIAWLPSLWIAARHWSEGLVAALGLIYVIGRVVYWRAYVQNPAQRRVGFMLSLVPTLLLALLALVGSVIR